MDLTPEELAELNRRAMDLASGRVVGIPPPSTSSRSWGGVQDRGPVEAEAPLLCVDPDELPGDAGEVSALG